MIELIPKSKRGEQIIQEEQTSLADVMGMHAMQCFDGRMGAFIRIGGHYRNIEIMNDKHFEICLCGSCMQELESHYS